MVFREEDRAELLRLLLSSTPLAVACGAVGVSVNQVYGYRRFDQGWATALDEALMAGRDPSLEHGTHKAHRWGGCRCPECRAVKASALSARNPTLSKRKVPPTARQLERFLELARQGKPLPAAASGAGLRVKAVRRVLSEDAGFRAAWEAVRHNGRPAALRFDAAETLRTEWMNGTPASEIAQLLGVGVGTVLHSRAKQGLPPRRG
ncbi:hypothetical protein ACWCWD_29275 [Streptomyces sp. NPDC001493]